MITIRRLQPGESALFKQLRLNALRDAPYAFSTPFEIALQRNDESWLEQAERTVSGADRATFIAFSDDLPVGMAAVYRDENQVDVGELLQVWVSPEHRSTRLIWDLMDEVFRWAKENGFQKILAGVTKGNARALRFYTKYGFSITSLTSRADPGGVYLEKAVM